MEAFAQKKGGVAKNGTDMTENPNIPHNLDIVIGIQQFPPAFSAKKIMAQTKNIMVVVQIN